MSKKKKKNTTSKTEEIKVKKNDEIIEKKQENKDTEVKDERIEKDIKKTTVDNEKIQPKTVKRKRTVILNFLILLVLISSLAYFIVSLLCFNSLGDVINGLLMVGISTFFVSACYTNPGRKKTTSYLALLGLFIYQVLGCLVSYGLITWPSNTIGSFVGKSLTDVVKWSTNNNIELIQEYEYSDSIKEYHVIYQDVLPDTKIKDIDKLTIAISEGPSPYKEIVLPNMVGWDTSQVLEFVEENYLSNVYVEFVQGTVNENTLIEQSKSGNVKRNDEIKLVFSYGEERHYTEVKMGDLTNKSKFEAEFYLKQYGIKYEFDYDFSKDIKRGYVMSQDVPEGTMISISENPQTVKVTISKGPEIVVPDLKKMSVSDITSWVIDNKLKIEFDDRYDDTALENEILAVNYEKDAVIEEGTVIKVTLSKGKLVMNDFKSYAEFREWAATYDIQYEEQHEFSDSVSAGEVIKYSYDKGATIKNGDVIIVTISDGKKIVVPSVTGLNKSQATTKLSNAGLGYSFVYKYSSNVEKGKAISQSISSGSEVSQGTTVTVTISNGPKPVSNSGSSNNSGSSSTPAPVCTPKTYTVSRELNNIFSNAESYSSVESQLYAFFAANYPNVKMTVIPVSDTGMSSGSYVSGTAGPGSKVTSCNTTAYTIKIAK